MPITFLSCFRKKQNKPGNRAALLLAAGLIGLLIVLMVPNPARLLASRLPLLTPDDWPGSRVSFGVVLSEPAWPWPERRHFGHHLVIENENQNTHISQEVAWFADPGEAAAFYEAPDPQTQIGPLVFTSNDAGKPVFRLVCTELLDVDSPRQCHYFAYWEHWYTEVTFWSQDPTDLPVSEIRSLATRIDRLLVAATNEPCFVLLCTTGK